ncbi:hypothetical protein [Adlercreutzia sp. ZJ141]|nr:hypothetical protein [Adlercreutzia sp. ZJ141]
MMIAFRERGLAVSTKVSGVRCCFGKGARKKAAAFFAKEQG